MALTKLNSASVIERLPVGSVLQTIQGTSDARYTLDSTNTWENTGFVSLTFPNNLQSNSKVLARIHSLISEDADGNWASSVALTIFENSTNKGNATIGIVSGNAHAAGHASSTDYFCERITGEILFTPSVLNGTYTLHCLAPNSYVRVIGGTFSTASTNYPYGNTQVILQEIKG
tara:strand:+ start:993 stop:1514 length:522 start_codon:yes stop_codon:yes gene_type:complete